MLCWMPFGVIKHTSGWKKFGFEPLFSIKDNVYFQGFKLLLQETETAPSIPVSIKIRNNFVKHSDLHFYYLLLEVFFLTYDTGGEISRL